MTELKPGWQRVKFGEVVRLNKETCKDPIAAGIERVIGLEHLEPGDLRVRSWADVADGTTFSNRVRPGQVLFGKRRAYQRKVAVADFDAICSGDIYVFETADQTQLLQELLPFICQTDSFFDYAVGTSAGSLSPRTNWKSLAAYEFALPPLEEQHRLVTMLIAWHKLASCYADSLAVGMQAQAAILRHFYEKRADDIPLSMFCRNLITYGIVQAGADVEGGVPYIRVTDMTEGELKLENLQRTAPEIAAKYKRSELDEGDLVLALRGPIGLAVTLPSSLRGANLTQGTARVSVRREWSTDYVRWALQSPPIQARINSVAKGSTFKEISLAALRDLPIPWVAPQHQHEVADILNSVDRTLRDLSERKTRANTRVKAALAVVLDAGDEN
jgi:type I restriction enzyme S subunit